MHPNTPCYVNQDSEDYRQHRLLRQEEEHLDISHSDGLCLMIRGSLLQAQLDPGLSVSDMGHSLSPPISLQALLCLGFGLGHVFVTGLE